MAETMFCPKCSKNVEVQKKGKNGKGEQLYMCKTCNKRFAAGESSAPVTPKADTKKASKKTESKPVEPKKAAEVKSAPASNVKTIIKVNSNIVKQIDGKDVSVDEAFGLVTSYFKEIVKDAAKVDRVGNTVTINFTVKTGTKG